MRIAQVLCAGSYAGAESVATRLSVALQPQSEASFVYVVRELRAGRAACDQMVVQITQTGAEVRVFDVESRVSPSLLRSLSVTLRRDRIDVVHAHAYKIAAQLPFLRHSAPFSVAAFTVHGFDQPTVRGRLFVNTMNVFGAYAADRLVCVSKQLVDHYCRYPTLGSRVRMLANAAPPITRDNWTDVLLWRQAARESLRTVQGIDSYTVSLLAVGRLVPVKNFALLLDALELFGRRGSAIKVHLDLVGEGPLHRELDAQARRLGLDVRLTGSLSDVEPLYAGSDALVLSSDSEGCPMVVLEAMAHGLPVVATEVGGVSDLVRDGREGLLVPKSNVAALAEAIERVASSAVLRNILGKQAWERAGAEFAPQRWAERHRSLYSEMLHVA